MNFRWFLVLLSEQQRTEGKLDGCSLETGVSLIAQLVKKSAYNVGNPSSIPETGRSAGEGIGYPLRYPWASLVAQLVKNLPAMRETSSISGLGRCPGEEKSYPLQYSGLDNSMDYTVLVAKSQTQLSDFLSHVKFPSGCQVAKSIAQLSVPISAISSAAFAVIPPPFSLRHILHLASKTPHIPGL